MLIKIISLSATIYLIQVIAYFLERQFGEKRGAFFSAFLQGILSSTALTLTNAQKSKMQLSHFKYHVLMVSSCVGLLASLLELWGIIWVSSPILFKELVILTPVYLSLTGVIIYHSYHLKEFETKRKIDLNFPHFLGAVKLALLLAGFIFLTSFLKETIGGVGPLAVSFLGGLFETHGVALAQVTLLSEGVLTLEEAYHHIMISVMAGFISKLGLTLFLVRNKYSYTLAATYVILAVVTLGIWFYY